MDEVLLINPSTHLLVCLYFETLMSIIRAGLPVVMKLIDRSGVLCYNFSITNDLTQMVNFPTRIPVCDSHSPAFMNFFLSSDASICSTMTFPLGNFDHVVSVSIDFPSYAQGDAPFHCIPYDHFHAD